MDLGAGATNRAQGFNGGFGGYDILYRGMFGVFGVFWGGWGFISLAYLSVLRLFGILGLGLVATCDWLMLGLWFFVPWLFGGIG